jgi:pimeloyl-ACP methyl ester carboxylesterase
MTDKITASLQANGIDLYYERQGEGEPLLLLHGGTGCHHDWAYAGRDEFAREYSIITPDARGHGRSTNPGKTITHRQCALDMIALLDDLKIQECKAVGISMGANILLHIATMHPERIQAMIVVSAAMYFPEQARAVMRQMQVEEQSQIDWELMRKRHNLGDEQIIALWQWTHDMASSYDDMNFTSASLSRISSSTLVIYGDRDFLYPVEMGVEMYRAIPKSALWVVPNGGHGPVFMDAAAQFTQVALRFLRK